MKRQQNVQEQVANQKKIILELTSDFRNRPTDTKWLLQLLERYNLNPTTGVLVSVSEIDEQGPLYDCKAIWLTEQKNFIELAAEADYKTKELLAETAEPKNLNQLVELNEHKKGFGKTFGTIALHVLQELNEQK